MTRTRVAHKVFRDCCTSFLFTLLYCFDDDYDLCTTTYERNERRSGYPYRGCCNFRREEGRSAAAVRQCRRALQHGPVSVAGPKSAECESNNDIYAQKLPLSGSGDDLEWDLRFNVHLQLSSIPAVAQPGRSMDGACLPTCGSDV